MNILTQSKSKTIITRSMITISLIVFTGLKDMFVHFILNGFSLHSNYKINPFNTALNQAHYEL